MVAIVIGFIIGSLVELQIGLYIGLLIFLAGSVYEGTRYFDKYGPMVLAQDGKAINRLFQYSLGYSLLVGFPLGFLSFYWGQQYSVLASIISATVAYPFFSMHMMGAFALGRFFNRNLDG